MYLHLDDVFVAGKEQQQWQWSSERAAKEAGVRGKDEHREEVQARGL
jgi:hypothetical protein